MSPADHPSFEDLSAFHDGEAPEWAAHVEGCAACRSQVDQLAALSAHVAGPVPDAVPAGGLDPVARALAAAGDVAGPSRAAGTTGRAEAVPGPVTIGQRPSPQAAPAGGPDQSRWTRWMAAASAAAVLLLVAGVLALVSRGGGGSDTTTALTDQVGPEPSAVAPESATPGVAGPGQGAGIGADIDGAVFGGDLGEIPDAPTLVARAGPDLRAGRDRATAEGRTTTAPPPRPGGGQGIAPPSPGVAPPSAGVVGTRPCETEARDRGGDLGPVVYFATATRAGVPAVVLGFAPPGGTGPVTAQVRAQNGCGLLLSAALP